jgi:hypothetical protein
MLVLEFALYFVNLHAKLNTKKIYGRTSKNLGD